MITDKEYEYLAKAFKHHPPKEGQQATYEAIRAQGQEFAKLILEKAPATRERSLAMTKIEEAIMWANAAIARS